MSEQDKASLIFNKDETRRTIRENTDLVGDSDNPVIEIRKPRQEQWIKCRGKSLEDLHWKDLVFLQDQDTMKEEVWLLNGDEDTLKKLRNTFEGVTRPSILVPCIDQTGTEFLWIEIPYNFLIVFSSASLGFVAPINFLLASTAFSPSKIITTIGPEDK